MDIQEKDEYTVELTPTSRIYFYEALEYIFKQHHLDRAEEISRELKQAAQSLNKKPNRGVPENRHQNYQSILYKRTKRAESKSSIM